MVGNKERKYLTIYYKTIGLANQGRSQNFELGGGFTVGCVQ